MSFTLNLPETETTGPRIKVFKRMRDYICDCFTPGNGKWAFFCALRPSDAERKLDNAVAGSSHRPPSFRLKYIFWVWPFGCN